MKGRSVNFIWNSWKKGLWKLNKQKVLQTLNHKNNYTVHYFNLKLCWDWFHHQKSTSGFIIPPVSPATTIKKRQRSEIKLQEGLFKLMNNCYGKTREDKRNRVQAHLMRPIDELQRTTEKSLKSFKNFDKNLAALNVKHTRMLWHKPTLVAVCVVDFAKFHKLSFHNTAMKNIWLSINLPEYRLTSIRNQTPWCLQKVNR